MVYHTVRQTRCTVNSMGGKYNDLVYTGMSIYQYIPVYTPGSYLLDLSLNTEGSSKQRLRPLTVPAKFDHWSNSCRGSKVPEERRMVLSDADSLGKAAKEFSEKPFLGASLGSSSAPFIR